MKSIFFGLTLASAALAQQVLGVTSVTYSPPASEPSPEAVAPAAESSDGGYYGSSAPAQATDYASATYAASSSEMTAAPTYTEAMPYASMTAGGYSSMGCGYGYAKASDGSCQQQSWVSLP